MEPEYQTVSQMYERLLLMIRQRDDTGFRLAVTDAVLQPRNPFEPANKRRPKPAVAIAISLFVVLALVFPISVSITRGRCHVDTRTRGNSLDWRLTLPHKRSGTMPVARCNQNPAFRTCSSRK